MLFRRRKPQHLFDRVKAFFWPERSFERSWRYFAKRVLRLSATPHAIAAGVAAGVFASFTPYLGFHFVVAAILSWIVAGNLLASALGTAIGNPLTFPFIWGGTLQLGRFILEGHMPAEFMPMQIGRLLGHLEFSLLWEPFLWPMTVGAIALGGLFALGFYVFTRWTVSTFQTQRRARLAERARRRARNAPLGAGAPAE